VTLAAAAAWSAGCNGSCGDLPGEPVPRPNAPAPAAVPDPKSAPDRALAGLAISAEEAAALVDAWLAAQVGGDIAAYEQLYASRFYGVKRAGGRTYTYNRPGWMADRRRMFRKKQVVSADDRVVTAAGQQAIVTFRQSWSSGGFGDVGPKRMVLVRERGLPRIAREEMLTSTVVDGQDRGAGPNRELLAPVLSEGNAVFVVLGPAEDDWAVGSPQLASRNGAFVAVMEAHRPALPAPIASWRGRAVTVFDGSGAPCAGAVAEIDVLTGAVPHFSTVEIWELSRTPATEIADQVWQMGGGHRLAVARVRGEPCPRALWARAGDTEPVVPLAAGPVGEAEAAAVLRRLRSLRGYRLIQKDFASGAGQGWWDEYDGALPRLVEFSRGLGPWGPARRFIAAAVRAGVGCGEFAGEFWALFEIQEPRGRLVLLTDEDQPGPWFFPIAAVDADGDGQPEFVAPGAIASAVDATYRVTVQVHYPDFDCPC
jgi:hypothetical protein